MKLLLTSGGLANESINSALRELVERPFDQLNLAFIPTAANLEPGDKLWLIEDLDDCSKLGFKAIDIVDISALPKEVWEKRLQVADVLLFEGGNTHHLLHWIRKSGLDDMLLGLLETRVYVGISAGTIVATPSLKFIQGDDRVVADRLGEAESDKGLELVDFYVEPHINSPYFPEMTFEHVAKKAKTILQSVFALDDQSALKVINKEITVVSEGDWKKFN